MNIPFFRSDVGADEIQAVTEVLHSGWLTTGAVAERFEHEFCGYVGASHAVAVSSCTNGLHAALIASGIGPGDEVLTTPLTFCGTIQAIEETGARAVLVDIADDLNINCDLLANSTTTRTRAILPVHVGGLPCDLAALRKHGIPVIEDAAHAFGSEWNGAPIGSASTAVFSFYANKNLITGEGGMVATADEELAKRVRRFASHGIQRSDWRYEVVERGFKCNLPDVLAAIGVAQLARARENAVKREEIANFYNQSFQGIEELEVPRCPENVKHAWHLYVLRVNRARDELIEYLAARGVQCTVHFRPIPMHVHYARFGPMEQWPVAAREYPRLVSLPIYPSLTEAEMEYVVVQIRSFYRL